MNAYTPLAMGKLYKTVIQNEKETEALAALLLQNLRDAFDALLKSCEWSAFPIPLSEGPIPLSEGTGPIPLSEGTGPIPLSEGTGAIPRSEGTGAILLQQDSRHLQAADVCEILIERVVPVDLMTENASFAHGKPMRTTARMRTNLEGTPRRVHSLRSGATAARPGYAKLGEHVGGGRGMEGRGVASTCWPPTRYVE